MNNYAMSWAPAPPKRLPASSQAKLGQTPGFGEGAVVSMLAAGLTSYAAGYLGWGYSKRNNRIGTFWYIVSAVAGMKALHDLSRI